MEVTVLGAQWTTGDGSAPWARVFIKDFDGTILVRTVRRPSGHREIVSVITYGTGAPEVVKDLPISRIEFFVRQLPDQPCEAEDWFEDFEGLDTTKSVGNSLDQAIIDHWTTPDHQAINGEAPPFVALDNVEVVFVEHVTVPRRPPLARPTGRDPDEFYRRVAEAYNEVMARTRAVAPVLAAEAGVPVRTVHGWVAEARRRGFLPPGRRGRA